MTSDDLTAWGAISMGTAFGAAATAVLLYTVPTAATDTGPSYRPAPTVTFSTPDRLTPHVDYAIIRGHVEIMVGPESASTGWVPEGLESSRAPR